MAQKIIQVGNSYAVTIPKGFLDEIRANNDDFVRVSTDVNKKRITIDFANAQLVEKVVNKEVYKVARQLLKRYLPAFKELATK